MASMVAKACNSTSSQMPAMSVRDKGSRNKRKFRADPPLADPTKAIPLPSSNECPSFEFSAEKFDNQHLTNGCNVCYSKPGTSDALKLDLGLSCTVGTSDVGVGRTRQQMEGSSDEFRNAHWNDLTESELEELVLKNLGTMFKSAIKKIVANGYSEEVATKAILRSGVWYGYKDIVSNIVDNTVAFLRSGREIDPSMEHHFEDLQQMEKYVLAELVCLLREVQTFFSTGDAMWRLLICDMNVSLACAMDGDPFSSSLGDASSNGNSFVFAQPQLTKELRGSKSNGLIPFKGNALLPSEPPKLASTDDGNTLQSESTHTINGSTAKPNFVPNVLLPHNDHQNSTSGNYEKTFSATGLTHTTFAEEKFVAARKVSGITKREYILRQKSMHFEKHNRAYGSKGACRAGKFRSFGGLVLDKKLKGVVDSTGLNAKNSTFKINKAIGFDAPADNISSTNGFTSVPTFGLESGDHTLTLAKSSISSTLPLVPVNGSPSLPVADTELSLSYPAKSIANPMPINYNIEASNCGSLGSTNGRPIGQWAPHDKKDEMIMKMVPRVRELQNQLQEWTEWANQKVMQAARRLSKDKVELKTLRQEKEEVEKLKKERQILEESTTKKIYEMESAMRKASRQIEQQNAYGARLELENTALRQEMEAAKLHAAESAASCEEVSKREKNTLMKFQSWEKQKIIFQEELAAEKSTLMRMQQKIRQAKEIQYQVEGKLNQETKAKEEVITQVSSLRKEREQIEASTQSKEALMKSKAEANLLKYKEDIEKLEKEIYQLRLKTESSKIAALRRGIDGSYTGGKFTYLKNANPSPKESPVSYISKMATTTDFSGVKRERECVMCLSEEMSVVFLPCAHQVVCTTCNELHEKQGMKDCPSCRSLIQRRVNVRFAHS